MANVYIEPRPKGREGSHINDYVVEDHADHVIATFKKHSTKPSSGRERTAIRHTSLAYVISTIRKKPITGARPNYG
jgi:hypothetical protein